MSLKIFVSSTTSDLLPYRDAVIKRLDIMKVYVMGMTSMTAEPRPPHEISANFARDCDVLIAIVAFRRGGLSPSDPEGRSYTQIEIEEAKRAGRKVLIYLLKDTPENRSKWEDRFNDLERDPEVEKWRRSLTSFSTPNYFNAGEIPDVIPAIHLLLIEDEKRRSKFYRNLALLLLAGIASVVLMFSQLDAVRSTVISWMHTYDDSVIFNGIQKGQYKTARLLENRADIQDNTSFSKDLDDARESFSLFANTFGSFREYEASFEAAAKRGVHLRFILSDFTQEREPEPNWVEFQKVVEDGPFNADETLAKGMNTINAIRELKARLPDAKIELRLNRKPILHTIWVRDPSSESGMAHLGVHYYGKISQSRWPAIRVSKTTGGDQLSAIAEQFEYLWSTSEVME